MPCQCSRYAKSSAAPTAGVLSGTQYATMLSFVSSGVLSCTSSTRPGPHDPDRLDPRARPQLVARLGVLVAREIPISLHQTEAAQLGHRERGRKRAMRIRAADARSTRRCRWRSSGRPSRALPDGSQCDAAGFSPKRYMLVSGAIPSVATSARKYRRARTSIVVVLPGSMSN